MAAGIYELTPGQRLKARQEALVKWARGGAPGEFAAEFAAADYSDQWGHGAADVAAKVRAARFIHPGLTVEAEKAGVSAGSGREVTLSQVITILPGDGESLRHEFQFTWRRESFWPWSWKLIRVQAPDLELPN